MAVFTAVDTGQLAELAGRYALPATLRAEGITQGIENTNYLLFGAGREQPGWVLTLLEKPTEIDYVQAVLAAADAAGLPVPLPLRTTDGGSHVRLGGRTAVVAPHLPGHHPESPGPAHCEAIGRFLGRLHRLVRPAATPRRDPQGLDWLLATAPRVLAGDADARTAIARLEREAGALRRLPLHTCHGDLFRDNALFENARLTGVIDWYNAAQAPGGYDLAIVLNDWCLDERAHLDANRATGLLRAYAGEMVPDPETLGRMPVLRAWAALRFWASRTLAAREGDGGQGSEDAARLYRGKPPAEQKLKLIAALDATEQARWRQLADMTQGD